MLCKEIFLIKSRRQSAREKKAVLDFEEDPEESIKINSKKKNNNLENNFYTTLTCKQIRTIAS